MTLSDYLNQTRWFLRDSQKVFWTDQQLITWINKARNQVVRDTFCTRSLGIVTLNAGQEAYTFGTVLSAVLANGVSATSIHGIKGIGLNWVPGNLRFDLNYKSWKRFSAYFRSLPQFQTFPLYWSMYAETQSFYVAPIPNQSYTCECDAIYLPTQLVYPTDADMALSEQYAELVPVNAAGWAKYYEQAYQEREKFNQMYMFEVMKLLSTLPSERVPSEYDNDDID